VTERPGHVVHIERTFAASAEDVFDAWTSPEVMRRWFHCAPDWATPEAEVDLRVGGGPGGDAQARRHGGRSAG
jgi:uncharacterized protein YndB with AHSA1/START domain